MTEDLILNNPWLARFFAAPNQLEWSAIVGGTVNPEIGHYLRPWLQLLDQPEGRAPIILPFVRNDTVTGWYATTRDAKGGRELGSEIRAWLGPTFLDLFEMAPIDRDPMAGAMRERSGGSVWRFSGSDAASNRKIVQRLDDFAVLLARRPALKSTFRRPVGAIRGEFERALLARDAARAEALIAELKATGRLNEENLKYLDVRLSAGLGLWPQIARDHWLIRTLCDLTLPPQIQSDLIEALYRTYVEESEALNDPSETRGRFDLHIAKRYPRLFASRRGIRTPRVVKSFLLFEQLQPSPSVALIAELFALLPDNCKRGISIEQIDIQQPPAIDESTADEAFDDGQFDRAFAYYRVLPITKKSISRMIHCVNFIDTPESRQDFLAAIDGADHQIIESLTAAVREKLIILQSPPVPSAPTELLFPTVATMSEAETPLGWVKWAEDLAHGRDLAGLELAVQNAATWDTEPFESEALSRQFADLLGNLGGEAAAVARRSVPQVFGSFFPIGLDPTIGTKPIASVLFYLIAVDERLSAADLELLAQLLSHLLTLGMAEGEYLSTIQDLSEIQDRIRSYKHLPWSLDICETLAIAPAPSEVARAARVEFFVKIVGQSQAFAHRIGPPDMLPIEFLAQDFGVGPDALTSLRRTEEADQQSASLPDLNGKTIGIYTLAETAGGRAKAALEQMFPGCVVEVNSDTVATAKLRHLAQRADLFVFAWKSSSHAAFYCIKEALPTGEPIWAPGKGTASILRAVLDSLH